LVLGGIWVLCFAIAFWSGRHDADVGLID
jgi:hypothetical protein